MNLQAGRPHRRLISRREHLLAIAAILILMTVVDALYTLFQVMNGRSFGLEELPAEVCLYFFACALWYLMFRAIVTTFGRGMFRRAAVTIAATLAATTSFTLGSYVILLWLADIEAMPDILSLIVTWIWALPMFVTWTLVLTAFAYGLDARERERQLAFAQQLAQDAQLQALRYQINPHFLYNTLNSISALILDGRNKLAEEMVMRLSNFFRSSLATDALHDVPLEDEIQLQRIYLDIEKVRFEDQLEVQFDLPERLATALVPGFILQPLVENAITHGIRGPGAMTRVWIAARDEDDRLIIEVRDDGPGCSGTKRGSGVGLHNVRERLAARFNDDHDFFAGPLPTGGYRARITVPLLFPA